MSKKEVRVKTYIIAVIFLVLLPAAQSLAQSSSSREYQIKAAFLYNFLMFVDWPPEKMGGSTDPIIIGIIGDDPFEDAFKPVKDKQVNNRNVIVKRFKGLEELEKSNKAERNQAIKDIKKCHLLYICRSEQAVLKEIVDLIKDRNVLTVGGMENFLELNGIINFVLEEDEVRFEINLTAAKQAKLQIRSQLMRLALSLEQLTKTSIDVGTLTATPRRLIPAAVTWITKDMIRSSGARDMYELLDIYVPNFQWLRSNWHADNMGLRGLISDRDDKYLLLVNGRVMNERTHYGAISERDLVMLDDIDHIDVIRGPGSMIYGPGAVSMVINIVTENATTFQGTAVTAKTGFIEEFYSLELKHGKVFNESTNLYIYAGISKYLGAGQDDSPLIFGADSITQWDFPIGKGKPVKYGISRDGAAYRDLPPLKFHVQLKHEDFDFWLRYTRGGKQYTESQVTVSAFQKKVAGVWTYRPQDKHPEWFTNDSANGYQQLTAYGSYHQTVSDTLTMDYVLSYDMFDYEKIYYRADYLKDASNYPWWFSHREDEYLARILARWTPNSRHSVAIGIEDSYEIFGLRSPGFPHDSAATERQSGVGGTNPWSANTYSVFGEHQWNINDRWTTFVGTRLDKGTYTDHLYSHRFAVVHTPTDKDTFKFMLARSLRQSFAEDSRMDRHLVKGNNKPETLNSIELRYERQHTNELWLAGSVFWNYLEVSAWNATDRKIDIVGDEKLWGFEVEAIYETERLRVMLSHGYAKLGNFELSEPGLTQQVTAAPYGYGDNLANWSNHITKLYAKYKITPKWSVDSSLRYYWGFPGKKDLVDYTYESKLAQTTPLRRPLRDPGYNVPFKQSIFLNLGLEYNPSKDMQVRLDGYGLLGWIDKDFNKRLFYGIDCSYRSAAAALALTVRYRF